MTASQAHSVRGRALIAAGGTGGHVYPALAVALELVSQGWSVDWLGTERGIEHRVVPAAGLPLHYLTVSGFRGKTLIARLTALSLLGISLWQSLRILRRIQPDVVLGMGGYTAGPAGIAAWLSRRPLVVHEQNAVAGTTNRLLAPLAKRILAGLPGGFRSERKVETVGNPVRAGLAVIDRVHLDNMPQFTPERPLRILVLGGSLGAAPLNRLIPLVASEMGIRGSLDKIAIWQQCGERNRLEAKQAWQDGQSASVRLDDFIEDMTSAYAWADLVIARAGALTVSELAVTGTASILIPLPQAIDDHQTRNAEVLAASGAAVLLAQQEATPERVADLLEAWIASPLSVATMSRAALGLSRADATDRVVTVIKEIAHASI